MSALYSSPNFIRNLKSRRLRWAGHVARMEQFRNAYRVLMGKPESKSPLGRPKRRSSSSVFCPRAGPSLQTQAQRLQFCPKAGLALQTQEPRLQFYYGRICAVASHCFLHPTLSLVSEQTLKDLKRSQGHQRGGEESGFG